MQTFEYNLCVFLIIYHVQYSFHFSDSSWQRFHDVSVNSHIFAVMRDGFSFNKVVVAMAKTKNRKKEGKGIMAMKSKRQFDSPWVELLEWTRKDPNPDTWNPWIQRVFPN